MWTFTFHRLDPIFFYSDPLLPLRWNGKTIST